MSIGSVFKKIGKVAASVGKIAALAGLRIGIKGVPVVPIALETITVVEELLGKGNGQLKKATAKRLIVEAIRAVEAVQGRDFVDEKKLVDNLDGIIDVLVQLANDLQLWDRLLGKEK